MVTDLTKGKPFRNIISFCLPLMLGQFCQQLYNMVDSIIVGRFCGTAELSAVGSTGSLTFLVIGFVTGCCTGFAIPIAHAFGEKNFSKLRKIYANSVYLTVFLIVFLTALTTLLTGALLKLMNTPDSIYQMACDYISIIFYGLVATYFYNLFAAVMRALGDSRTPLYLLLFSSVLNICLDLFFVLVVGIAVRGVAIATVVSQGISAVLAFIIIKKKFAILKTAPEERKFSLKYCRILLYNGLPMALQISVTAIGSIMLQSAVNKLGEAAIAAVTVGGKIQMVVIMPSETIGITMSTYCGQNYGAGRMDRIKDGMGKALIIGFCYSAVAFVFSHFFGGELAKLFVTSDQTEVISLVALFLRTCSWFYPILAALFILRNSVQGLGYSVPAMMAGVFELIARGVMSFWVIPEYGYSAVTFANPSAWCAAFLLLIPVYFISYKLAKKKLGSQ